MMQTPLPATSAAPRPTVFPTSKVQGTPTHLVAHWLKDKEGKLYQVWVSEKV